MVRWFESKLNKFYDPPKRFHCSSHVHCSMLRWSVRSNMKMKCLTKYAKLWIIYCCTLLNKFMICPECLVVSHMHRFDRKFDQMRWVLNHILLYNILLLNKNYVLVSFLDSIQGCLSSSATFYTCFVDMRLNVVHRLAMHLELKQFLTFYLGFLPWWHSSSTSTIHVYKTSISKGYIRFNIYSIPSRLFLPSHLNMLEQGTSPPNSSPLVLDIPKFTHFR